MSNLPAFRQSVGYGLLFELNYFLRNTSIIGGLLILLADSLSQKKRHTIFAGLPVMNEVDRPHYVQLAGRVLLVFLFLSFIFSEEYSVLRIALSVLSFLSCVMVVVGFKTKFSAIILIMLLSIGNVFINNWWALHHTEQRRDFLKFEFFQTISICGGFLLMMNNGPGELSYDQVKKDY